MSAHPLTSSIQSSAASAAPRAVVLPEAPPDFTQRNPALDGIRGFAFALVFLFHNLYLLNPVNGFEDAYGRVIRSSWWCLDLFFVLSGFLITGILLDTRSQPRYFRLFYARRVLRIVPLYTLALLLCHFNFSFMYPKGNGAFAQNEIWYWMYLYNHRLAMTAHQFSPDPVTGHLWSLCVEEQFYLLWPLVVFLLGRRKLAALCCALVVSSLLVRIHRVDHWPSTWNTYFFSPGRFDGLALGSLLAIVARSRSGLALVRRLAHPFLALMLAALAGLFYWRSGIELEDPMAIKYGITIFSFLALGFVASAVVGGPSSPVVRFFSFPFFTMLGKYSYGLYIFHSLFRYGFESVGELAIRKIPALSYLAHLGGHSQIPPALLRCGLSFCMLLPIALICYHFFEKDFLSLKVYFEYETERRKAHHESPSTNQ